MKKSFVQVLVSLMCCQRVVKDKLGFTFAYKEKYKANFNQGVIVFLQVSCNKPASSQAETASTGNSTTTSATPTIPVNAQTAAIPEEIFYLSNQELEEKLNLENTMKDSGLLEEDKLQSAGTNFVKMTTYPVPTSDDIEASVDERELGIEPKKREYSSDELAKRKEEILKMIFDYYSEAEKKIPVSKNDELQTLRINRSNAIFLHNKNKDYFTGDLNFPTEIPSLNLYWLNRIRVAVIKEQRNRNLLDENGNTIQTQNPTLEVNPPSDTGSTSSENPTNPQ